ncbi:hypothetical protein [Streptococcus suis]|uniref:hypothetical protein n=1 Tax=Streptococcus suis TaxID=1307 RepID=UPI000CF74EE5|nr:hypothetical protein [Streptococcus suis]MCK4023133.1 hypothetical protein [Streptococcus suis]MCQ9277080.1 hypothetical protein [Streptococcus suis]
MFGNWMVLLFGLTFVLLVVSLFFSLRKGKQAQGFYDIFSISEGRLTIQAAVPINYPLEVIERVEFSRFATTKSGFTNFAGQLRIIKKNGRTSRPYYFDSSVLYQKFVAKSRKEEMDETIELLTAKLERHGIPARKVGMK